MLSQSNPERLLVKKLGCPDPCLRLHYGCVSYSVQLKKISCGAGVADGCGCHRQAPVVGAEQVPRLEIVE